MDNTPSAEQQSGQFLINIRTRNFYRTLYQNQISFINSNLEAPPPTPRPSHRTLPLSYERGSPFSINQTPAAYRELLGISPVQHQDFTTTQSATRSINTELSGEIQRATLDDYWREIPPPYLTDRPPMYSSNESS
ncbi:hypothetical protein CROQUDRAFT_95513 [Cronartium quercuum f. sp. fusiforme G11]|uniref:Uncharacterized protein n=1 Tax=Cronartium quercuum f. sp. fusiforme G11 TaxID=708437 RepID=A0A9P6NI20_9BASI|nr:hypothetical protein CROQUDRAFT_95513 [Cronartium quercuum f. sp. fusiforme G11]